MQCATFSWGKDQENNDIYIGHITPKYVNDIPLNIAHDTIQQIIKSYPPPYTLMLSGGVDSQAMLYAWMTSGVPFDAVTFEYVDDTGKCYNDHDISYIKQYSILYNINNIKYLKINPFSFYETELLKYATTYQCISPQITLYMKMSEYFDSGTVLFSGDFIHYYRSYNYTILGLGRYAAQAKRNIIPYFFSSTSELSYAFTNIYNCIKYKNDISLDSGVITDMLPLYYKIKCMCYTYGGMPVIPQPNRTSGFEMIKDYYDQFPDQVLPIDRLRYANRKSKRLFDVRFRYKLTELIKYNDNVTFIEHPSPVI